MSEPASAPLLLGLDTATSIASVALFDGQRVISEATWLAGREHSSRLLVEAELAFERVGRSVLDLTGLAVARGPGSFTGVRVALSVAKGIAAALHLPLWAVSSLEVLAAATPETTLSVRAVAEAGRGRYATALYQHGREIEPPRLATLDELLSLLGQPSLVTGELGTEARRRIEAETAAVLAPQAAGARRAGFLAELAWRQALAGQPGDAAAADALYVSG